MSFTGLAGIRKYLRKKFGVGSLFYFSQPYALAIALISIFTIFIIELIAFRWGTAKLAALGITHDPHGHGISQDGIGTHAAHGPESERNRSTSESPSSSEQETTVIEKEKDLEAGLETAKDWAREHGHHQGHSHTHSHDLSDQAASQIVGIAILEFGVVLHR
jgi:solute carrier family 39 (zinc transporter), member 1/2/3